MAKAVKIFAPSNPMAGAFMVWERRTTLASCLWLAAAAHFCPTGLLCADEFLLKDGRKIAGVVRSEKPIEGTKDKQFVVELAPGFMVLINQSEIKQPIALRKGEQEYLTTIKSEFADTVEFHLKQAGYCRKHALTDYEVAHFERVLDLEPENEVARAGLEYMKDDKSGRWIKRNQLMTEGRGKVKVGSKYLFPEVIAMEEAQEKANKDRISLANELRKWQQDVLTNNKRATDSMSKLKALDGPVASAAIADVLFPKANVPLRKEAPTDGIKQLLIEVLERLADPGAIQSLIRLSLTEPSPPIRDQSLDVLSRIAPKAATVAFIGALNSDNPENINDAARALAAMRDESSILPLIEKLVTTHKRKIEGNNSTNVGFGSGTDGGFTMGKTPAQVVSATSRNQDVLGALTTITGESFGYDQAAWLSWYDRTHSSSSGDLRRDP